MLRWLLGAKQQTVLQCIAEKTEILYRDKLLPLEECYQFHAFHSPPLTTADFRAKPIVLLIGEYSTGKTTFIQHILGEDFPGMQIGPETTTDCFTAVMHSEQSAIISGRVLVSDVESPFQRLSKFGNAFLNHFQGSQLRNKILENITFIDTPGILSGQEQLQRGYDFEDVIAQLAEIASKIVMLFDTNKLDFSYELKQIVQSLRPFEEKMWIFLNKADVGQHQLLHMHAALMWSLGRILVAPEMPRVYMGSFWDQPLHHRVHSELFAEDKEAFCKAIMALPQADKLWKLNDLVKRARLARAHAHIICHLKQQMPAWYWGSGSRQAKKEQLIAKLDQVYATIQHEHHTSLSPADFPSLSHMTQMLKCCEFHNFSKYQEHLFDAVNQLLKVDIPEYVGEALQQQKEISPPCILYNPT